MGAISHSMKVRLARLDAERVHVRAAIGKSKSSLIVGWVIVHKAIDWVLFFHLLQFHTLN